MNGIRRSLGFATAIALIGLALPGYAAQSQNKTYTLTMCVGTWNADGSCNPSAPSTGTNPTTVQARLTNTSPKQSSSTFGSVDLFANLKWTIKSVDSAYLTSQGPSVSYLPFTDFQTVTGHIMIENLSSVKPGDSLNVTFSVTNASCGDGSWAGSLIWSGSNFGGNVFTMDPAPKSTPVTSVACGSFSCAAQILVQPTPTYCDESSDQGVECIIGVRGPYNKDGSACSALPTYISNFSPNTADQKVHVRWPNDVNSSVSTAAFAYRINTSTASPVDVAWIEDANGPVGIEALPCETTPTFLQTALPQRLGSLAQDVNGSKKQLKVTADASVVAPPAFSIVVDSEMMRVTNISSGTWTVTRGWGNTQPVPHLATHSVMYSPLPIIPNRAPFTNYTNGYAPGNHAHMCYTLFGQYPGGTYYTDLIDIGDGWGLSR